MANYPVPYQPNWGYGGIGQQVYPQLSQAMMPVNQQSGAGQNDQGLIWVDGEVGAKAFQMPAGWPCNKPIALWDTNDTVIYLKSTNPMGMPNPLQKAHYTLDGTKSGEANRGFSGEAEQTRYVTKDDLEKMKQELMDTLNTGRHEKEE